MQNTSSLYKSIVASDNHWFETRLVIGDSGNLITKNGEQILFGGIAIAVSRTGPDSGYAEDVLLSVKTSTKVFEDGPEVGKAVAGEIDVSMFQPAGTIPKMARIVPYVRANGTLALSSIAEVDSNGIMSFSDGVSLGVDYLAFDEDSGAYVSGDRYLGFMERESDTYTSEWIQKGEYFIDTRYVSQNDDNLKVVNFHGFDAMLFGEQPYVSANTEGNMLDTDVVREIASMMRLPGKAGGLSVDSRTWDIMTGGYRLPLITNYTLRETLGIIASMYVGSFIITDIGELRLVSMLELPKETRYLIDSGGSVIVFGSDRITV